MPKWKGIVVPEDTHKCYGTKKGPFTIHELMSVLSDGEHTPNTTVKAWLAPKRWNNKAIAALKEKIASCIGMSQHYAGKVDNPTIFINKPFLGSLFARPSLVEIYFRPNPLPKPEEAPEQEDELVIQQPLPVA